MQGLPPELTGYIPAVLETHFAMVARAVIALPLAAGLGAVLAFRPRRMVRDNFFCYRGIA